MAILARLTLVTVAAPLVVATACSLPDNRTAEPLIPDALTLNTAELEDGEFVEVAYAVLLGRPPTSGERDEQEARLPEIGGRAAMLVSLRDASGAIDANCPGDPERYGPADVAPLAGLSDDQFVVTAYLIMLGRPADQVGFDDFVTYLRDGGTRVDVLRSLLQSAEFTLVNCLAAGA